MPVARQRGEHVPARRMQSKQRQRHVVLQRGACEQRDDLVGARQPAVRALVRFVAAPPGAAPLRTGVRWTALATVSVFGQSLAQHHCFWRSQDSADV